VRDCKKIKAWALAHRLTLDVYRVTLKFPQGEQYGLTSQLRRATSSDCQTARKQSGLRTARVWSKTNLPSWLRRGFMRES